MSRSEEENVTALSWRIYRYRQIFLKRSFLFRTHTTLVRCGRTVSVRGFSLLFKDSDMAVLCGPPGGCTALAIYARLGQ